MRFQTQESFHGLAQRQFVGTAKLNSTSAEVKLATSQISDNWWPRVKPQEMFLEPRASRTPCSLAPMGTPLPLQTYLVGPPPLPQRA